MCAEIREPAINNTQTNSRQCAVTNTPTRRHSALPLTQAQICRRVASTYLRANIKNTTANKRSIDCVRGVRLQERAAQLHVRCNGEVISSQRARGSKCYAQLINRIICNILFCLIVCCGDPLAGRSHATRHMNSAHAPSSMCLLPMFH